MDSKTHSIYSLAFMANEVPIIFYVGHTNDIRRRRNEHLTNPFNIKHPEYNTMKYRWCRSLRDLGIDYDLIVLHENVELDEMSEYLKILEIARDNASKGWKFYDNLPLTNMKGGDLLSEMLAADVRSHSDIIEFYDRHNQAKSQSKINYARGHGKDNFEHTPDAQTEKARLVIAWLREHADLTWQEFQNGQSLKDQREQKYQAMLADPKRIERIKQETLRLMAEDRDE